MKKTYLITSIIGLAMAISASADTLAGYDSWNNPNKNTENKASFSQSYIFSKMTYSSATQWSQSGADRGSGDGTYGSVDGADTNNEKFSSSLKTATDGAYLDIQIKNTGTNDLALTSFNFDGWKGFKGSVQNWTVEVLEGSDIKVGPVASGSFKTQRAKPGAGANDYEDVDVALTGMTLAKNQSATFRLTLKSTTGTLDTHIDSVAITGSVVVPEPVPPGQEP